MPAIHHRSQHRILAAALTVALGVASLAACTSSGGSDGDAKDKKKKDDGGGGGAIVGSGTRYKATIRRTTDGVPHITAKTVASAAFGQGYAGGEDRTCDLADQVVKIKGERSRWFGAGDENANLDSDVQWLGIGIFDKAAGDWAKLGKQAKGIFEAYVDGWNTHLSEVGVDGISGWCKGEKWVGEMKPLDLYAYARSITLNASGTRIGAFIPDAAPPGAAPAGAPASLRQSVRQTTERPAARPVSDGPKGLNALRALAEDPVGSNGWAIGKERSKSGGGMLVANPHFPWEGELRFWESHLTVPGELDIYGAQLSGVPGIAIGFTKDFAWTHTVSAGNRFTAYSLDLVPGDPLSYRFGDETRPITPTDHTIEVLGSDGKLTKVKRTTYASQYGPVINFPGYGWTEEHTISYRDANIDDDEFIDQYFGMFQATSYDEFKAVHEKANGIPLFNTVATSSDGRAWYADTSATPNLSKAAIANYEATLESDPVVKVAADNGAVLLDGSDPANEWVSEPGARDPGLVPPSKQPQTERRDYVFNANDSYWISNAQNLLTGDYSRLHGRQDVAPSYRTRENAVILDDTTSKVGSGKDGFTLDSLADLALHNEGFSARELRKPFADRCDGKATVDVPAVDGGDDTPGLPAATVDIAQACKVLARWDGIYDLDRAGPALWREMMEQVPKADRAEAGQLWATPFDPAEPVTTPSGLAPVPAGQPDPMLVWLGHAVQTLKAAGFEPDVKLGDIQFAVRNGKKVPIHGGQGVDGTTNVVGCCAGASIMDPALRTESTFFTDESPLRTIDGKTGYFVNNGTSFLMTVAFGKDGPKAKAFLTYSDTEDRKDPNYTAATERFSKKDWRSVAFTEAQVAGDTKTTTTVKG